MVCWRKISLNHPHGDFELWANLCKRSTTERECRRVLLPVRDKYLPRGLHIWKLCRPGSLTWTSWTATEQGKPQFTYTLNCFYVYPPDILLILISYLAGRLLRGLTIKLPRTHRINLLHYRTLCPITNPLQHPPRPLTTSLRLPLFL